jgi:hypothetical protein
VCHEAGGREVVVLVEYVYHSAAIAEAEAMNRRMDRSIEHVGRGAEDLGQVGVDDAPVAGDDDRRTGVAGDR